MNSYQVVKFFATFISLSSLTKFRRKVIITTTTKQANTMKITLAIITLFTHHAHDTAVLGKKPESLSSGCIKETEQLKSDPEIIEAFRPFYEKETIIVSNDYDDSTREFDTQRYISRDGDEGVITSSESKFDLREAARAAESVCEKKGGIFKHINVNMDEPGMYDEKFGSTLSIVHTPVCLSEKCHIETYIKNYHYILGGNRESKRIKVTSGCEEKPWDRFFMKKKKKNGEKFIKTQSCSWVQSQWPNYRATVCDPSKKSKGGYDNAFYACPSTCCACHEVLTDKYHHNGKNYTCSDLANFGYDKRMNHCNYEASRGNGLANAITTCATTCGLCPTGFPLPGTPITH